jgi:hypothetical protein
MWKRCVSTSQILFAVRPATFGPTPAEEYTIQRLHSLYGRGERDINLKNPIPVYLTYQTVFFDKAGQVQTHPDIYGLDKNVTALLSGEITVAHVPVARNYAGESPVRAHTPLSSQV